MALMRLRISDAKHPIEQVCGLALISKLKFVGIPSTGDRARLVWVWWWLMRKCTCNSSLLNKSFPIGKDLK